MPEHEPTRPSSPDPTSAPATSLAEPVTPSKWARIGRAIWSVLGPLATMYATEKVKQQAQGPPRAHDR
jgi:hypothetical protein